MELIDTHAHLDAFQTHNALEAALSRARAAGVNKIITCSARTCDWLQYSNLAQEFKGEIFWQLGIHPTEVREADETLLEKALQYLDCPTPPVSIGEIGLDFYRLEGTVEEIEKAKSTQLKFFRLQLDIAKRANLPVCVHARSAVMESIKEIKASNFDFKKVVFHCFSGSVEEIRLLNSLGGRASFTGIITYKNAAQMREAMLAQGLDKLMFETDCPYLAPTPLRGKDNEPAYMIHTAIKAAEVFGISLENIAKISTYNACEFFSL